jgi:MoaA/NifB/PqqE/SkfB family radical SAM enzyme
MPLDAFDGRNDINSHAPGAYPKPRRLAAYLSRDAALAARYDKLRRHSAKVVGSSYDVSRVCNLRCEGCLFFEGSDYVAHADEKSDAEWDAFFAAEAARGVNFPYLAGAEPGLQRQRLALAAKHFRRGVVFTNGTVPLDPALPFTIHVSLWGAAEETERLRGGDSFERALRNFADDPRARFAYTVNAQNIASARRVAEICAAHGAKLTFSLFSPTTLYNWKLANATPNDDEYFRISAPGENLALSAEQLIEIRGVLDSLVETYPDTLIYTKAYNHWVTDPAGLYEIDPETGWALDCETRRASYHKHFRTDLTSSGSKCCSPNIDCRECRAYAMASGTAVSRFRRFLGSEEDFRRWVDMAEQWCRLFFHDWDTLP